MSARERPPERLGPLDARPGPAPPVNDAQARAMVEAALRGAEGNVRAIGSAARPGRRSRWAVAALVLAAAFGVTAAAATIYVVRRSTPAPAPVPSPTTSPEGPPRAPSAPMPPPTVAPSESAEGPVASATPS